MTDAEMHRQIGLPEKLKKQAKSRLRTVSGQLFCK
jgi:hypothetical protein